MLGVEFATGGLATGFRIMSALLQSYNFVNVILSIGDLEDNDAEIPIDLQRAREEVKSVNFSIQKSEGLSKLFAAGKEIRRLNVVDDQKSLSDLFKKSIDDPKKSMFLQEVGFKEEHMSYIKEELRRKASKGSLRFSDMFEAQDKYEKSLIRFFYRKITV